MTLRPAKRKVVMFVRCRGVRNGRKCGKKASRNTELCLVCARRLRRGGFVKKTCRPWEKQKLVKQTRAEAKKVFQR